MDVWGNGPAMLVETSDVVIVARPDAVSAGGGCPLSEKMGMVESAEAGGIRPKAVE